MSFDVWESSQKDMSYRDEYVMIKLRKVAGPTTTSDKKVKTSSGGWNSITYYATVDYQYEVVLAKTETEYCGGGEVLKRKNFGIISEESYTKAKEQFNTWLREYMA